MRVYFGFLIAMHFLTSQRSEERVPLPSSPPSLLAGVGEVRTRATPSQQVEIGDFAPIDFGDVAEVFGRAVDGFVGADGIGVNLADTDNLIRDADLPQGEGLTPVPGESLKDP